MSESMDEFDEEVGARLHDLWLQSAGAPRAADLAASLGKGEIRVLSALRRLERSGAAVKVRPSVWCMWNDLDLYRSRLSGLDKR